MRNPPRRRRRKSRTTQGRRESELMIKFKYEIILYWSKDDQAFIAEVPELPGCSADGATYQEALAKVELIIQEWIETAQELGRPGPEPRGRLMHARRTTVENAVSTPADRLGFLPRFDGELGSVR